VIVEAHVKILAPAAKVWATITNIHNSANFTKGIQRIVVLEQPKTGLVGFKWQETRMLFGEPTTVEKSIIAAQENAFYTTRAEDAGFVFLTTNQIKLTEDSVTLTGIHETRPQGFVARLKAIPLIFFRGAIRKAIVQDLDDIKAAIERS
jgi:hypothetical protein